MISRHYNIKQSDYNIKQSDIFKKVKSLGGFTYYVVTQRKNILSMPSEKYLVLDDRYVSFMEVTKEKIEWFLSQKLWTEVK